MRTGFIATIIAGCFFTSIIAFAEILSLGQATPAPIILLVIGFCLLGLAGIGRRKA